MPITMSYRCRCGYASSVLQDAEAHADSTGHTVGIIGELSPHERVASVHQIERNARRKAEESEIMRVARERGLLPVQQKQLVRK